MTDKAKAKKLAAFLQRMADGTPASAQEAFLLAARRKGANTTLPTQKNAAGSVVR